MRLGTPVVEERTIGVERDFGDRAEVKSGTGAEEEEELMSRVEKT